MRRWSGALFFLLFFLVPYLDLFRLDLPSGQYYWFTMRFPLSQALPLLLTVLFLVFSVFGLSFYKPRLFCSHLCPHATASRWLRTLIRWKLDLVAAIVLTPLVSFTLLSYFVAPRTVWAAVTQGTSTMILAFSLVVTLFIGLLLLRLRQNFCKLICPYGFFQQLIVPASVKKGHRVTVTVLLVLLAAGTVSAALLNSGAEVDLTLGARTQTAPDTMTYTYLLSLTNNRSEPETFTLHFTGLQPLSNVAAAPILVPPSAKHQVPLIFQVRKAESVQFDVCAAKADACTPFHFTLSGP